MPGRSRVIFFDGDCVTCNRALGFVAERLPEELEMSFIPLESELAESLLCGHDPIRIRDALIYLDEVELLQGAAAVKKVLSFMPRWRQVGKALDVLPDALVENAYDAFAAKRYLLNKRLTVCEIPSKKLTARLAR